MAATLNPSEMTHGTPVGRLTPGARLAGRYRLLEEIGAGSMGRVYRAHDELLGRDVAIKLLDLTSSGTGDVAATYLREAQTVASLGHPGIARIFDAGSVDRHAFIAMELVPGRTLRDLLRERGRLDPTEAARLAAQIADALAAAHRQGIVHCDVKPQNVLVTPDGTAKLVDFGIARATSVTATAPTGEIRGSAAYLAPEQARGDGVDDRTDVYALGAVLYELLVGRPPFGGPSLAAVLSQRLVADPLPPRALDPTIPPALERVVLTALARDPAERFPDAGAFRDVLRAAGEATWVIPPVAAAGQRGASPWPVGWRWPRRVGVAVAGALLAVGLLGQALRAGPPSTTTEAGMVPDLVDRPSTAAPAPPPAVDPTPGAVLTRPVERVSAATGREQRPAAAAPAPAARAPAPQPPGRQQPAKPAPSNRHHPGEGEDEADDD